MDVLRRIDVRAGAPGTRLCFSQIHLFTRQDRQTDRQTESGLVTTSNTQQPSDTTTHEATRGRASRITRSATLRLRAAGRPSVASAARLPLEPAVAAVEASPLLAAEALVELTKLPDALHR